MPQEYNATAVAVDKDKHSPYAVRWAIDHLLHGNPKMLILIHVGNIKFQLQGSGVQDGHGELTEMQKRFNRYRVYCARKGIKVKEIVLDDVDVSKALLDYINKNMIANIVLGSSTRTVLTRKFKNHDVPAIINKSAPVFCSVYVIASGKVQSVRPAARPSTRLASPPSLPRVPNVHSEQEDVARVQVIREERKSVGSGRMRIIKRNSANLSADNIDLSIMEARISSARDSFSDDIEPLTFRSVDITSKTLDFTKACEEETKSSSSNDVADEMERLKLELKKTLNLYSTACKEAISANKKAKELHQWKLEKSRHYEQARLAEEAAVSIAEKEKAKCRAAIEAAEKARKLAEREASRRKHAELKAKREEEEKDRALNVLSNKGVRYRKYAIDELEEATDQFSESLKIGEGGFGSVYRGKLDHTPVAIKVLRPDAAQGRKQFQQEVEVLCCMRHPNLVLLLGACPDSGCLVYEYMYNGSLEDRLFRKGDTPPIPWNIRFRIAAEIATGLLFLHLAKPEPLVHRDLKPANILLDRNYRCKISDVGLSRLVPPSVSDSVTQYHMTSAAGTFCYIDPEYQQTGMLGIKSDVYSLGIMLLQIITARPPIGLTHHVERAIVKGTFRDLLDPTVMDWPVEEAVSYAKLALRCAELRRKDRPDLGSVVLPELKRLSEFGHSHGQSSQKSSPH